MTTESKNKDDAPAATDLKAVAVAGAGTALSADLGGDLDIFGDAGLGNEGITNDDILIPRLSIAQALSPQIKKQKAEYLEGLEEGGLFNSATGEIYTQPMLIVPVSYRRRFVEWIPRSAGGGLVNPDHDESILDRCRSDEDTGGKFLENGNEIIETPEHFVLVVKDDGSWEEMVISMSKSRRKVSKAWNLKIRNLKVRNPNTGQMVAPARFYGAWSLKTVMETNDKGDYFNYKIDYAQPTIGLSLDGVNYGRDVYLAARSFFDLIQEGKVSTTVEAHTEGEGGVSGDIPF